MIKHSFFTTKRAIKKLQRGLAILGVFALTFALSPVATVRAATLTSMRDTMSTLTDSANSSHTIEFITPTGVTAGQTVTYTFPTGFALASEVVNNFDFAVSAAGSCASFTDKTLALSPSGTTWGIDVTGQVITVTSGTDTIAAGRCVQLEAGPAATDGATGAANTIANQTVAQNNSDSTIDINVGSGTDTGSLAVEIIADDSVNVTATVDPSITFSISDVAIGFGTLASGAVRYATGDLTGGTTETTAAHTMSAGTNAAGGLAVTYNGGLLTSAANTIAAATSVTPPGTQTIEQFAIAVDDGGTAFSITSGYDQATPVYSYVANTTTTLFSASAPLSSTAVEVHYLVNIAANTEAGIYSTNITYIATGTF